MSQEGANMTRIGIVCDSTCDLEPAWLEEHGVTMVPLKVHFQEETYRDWMDLTPDQFYVRLVAAPKLPTTSQPSPADFTAAYERLAAQGIDEIVSVHLTSALSGTFESATLAAKDCSIPVRVVDTLHVTQANGLAVKAAIEARDAGGDAAAVEEAATVAARTCSMFFILDTLEYLVKGGRAGKATGLAAAVLNLKPVLTFNDEGTIEPFKKVKGLRKAMTELAAHVAKDSQDGKVRLVIFHASAPQLAGQMREALDAAGADYELDSIGFVGAVIGTYAGPGAVGLAYYPIR